MRAPVVRFSGWAERGGRRVALTRAVAEEVPVAFTYDRATHAVMMASPADLEDFAVGFSLSEGIIAKPEEIAGIAMVETVAGIELRIDLAGGPAASYRARRRRLVGPVGCGLCGIESLAEAVPSPPPVSAPLSLPAAMIGEAMAALIGAQTLNAETRAVHGAGFWQPGRGLLAVREDVGRHNALDKLIGALGRSGEKPSAGMIVLTSRVSVELVQKAAMAGVPVLAAVSAPTALALRLAEAAGMTLIAVARADGFEVYTRPDRIEETHSADVA